MKHPVGIALLCAGMLALAENARADDPAKTDESPKTLTICADPGNMPLSNQKGEGFENKIAQVLGDALGANLHYYWRPSIERGLMRTTLSEGNCDLWMDMATDTEGAAVTAPLYRSTFVLVYRKDKGYGTFKSLDDPRLQKLRIGVFQVSAARQALVQHGIMENTVIHYLSHNADIVTENRPSYQIQEVIDGKLDAAAAWGPMAGYYQAVEKAPLVVQPMNTIDDSVPLEFDMSLAVPRGRPDFKAAVERAMHDRAAAIKQILVAYGVPLVRCDECIVDGDLPSHGAYKPVSERQSAGAEPSKTSAEKARLAELKQALEQGANPNDELDNAIVAADLQRVKYLLEHGADANARFNDGHTPLTNATRFGFDDIAKWLVEHKADPNRADISHWTPLMYAAWNDSADQVRMLVAHGARLDLADDDGLSPLAIAAQNAKLKSATTLVAAGAEVDRPAGKGRYTPLMLAANAGSLEIVDLLLKHGAKVNARNDGGITALMIVAAKNEPKVAARLIAAGADVTATSEDGRTALKIAQANNNEEVLKLLQAAAGGHSS